MSIWGIKKQIIANTIIALVLCCATAEARFERNSPPLTPLEYPEFSAWLDKQKDYSLQRIMETLSLPYQTETHYTGRAGNVYASPDMVGDETYVRNWVRDAAITHLTLQLYFNSDERMNQYQVKFPKELYKKYIEDFTSLTQFHQSQNAPYGVSSSVYEPNGRVINVPWGLPQRDGPALRALALIVYAKTLSNVEAQKLWTNVIYHDVEHTAHHHRNSSFEPWEETETFDAATMTTNFFTMMTQLAALKSAVSFLEWQTHSIPLNTQTQFYKTQILDLEVRIDKLWSPEKGYTQSFIGQIGGHVIDKYSRLDSFILLGSLYTHKVSEEVHPFFAPTSPYVFATAQVLRNKFKEIYPLNKNHARYPGTLFGRYPEDRFDPEVRNALERQNGNPWALTTFAAAEIDLQKAIEIKNSRQLIINSIELPAFQDLLKDYPVPNLEVGIQYDETHPIYIYTLEALMARAKNDIQTMRMIIGENHKGQNEGGPISEQIDKNTGGFKSLKELTWSHAAFLRLFQVWDIAITSGLPANPLSPTQSFFKRIGQPCKRFLRSI